MNLSVLPNRWINYSVWRLSCLIQEFSMAWIYTKQPIQHSRYTIPTLNTQLCVDWRINGWIYVMVSLSCLLLFFMNVKGKGESSCHVWLFVTPWTIARQAPLPMGILQARILELVAMSSSRGSSQPRDQTQVICTAGRLFTLWATKGSYNKLLTNDLNWLDPGFFNGKC